MDYYDEKISCEMEMEIEKIKEKIIESYNPERIILFGSFAKGENNENSDVDIETAESTNLFSCSPSC